MQAFNSLAKQQMQIENEQNQKYADNEKTVILADAKSQLRDQERRINDTKNRIIDFSGFEKKEDDKSLPACEPEWLYALDQATMLPQFNSTAIYELQSMPAAMMTEFMDSEGKMILPPGVTKDMMPKGFMAMGGGNGLSTAVVNGEFANGDFDATATAAGAYGTYGGYGDYGSYGSYGDYGSSGTAAGAYGGYGSEVPDMSGGRLDMQIANTMMMAMQEEQMNRERTVDDIMIDILMQGEMTSYGTPVLSFQNLFTAAI